MKADKYTHLAYRWCAKRGIAYVHQDLAKLLRRVIGNAREKALTEGIRTGGNVAVAAMRGGRE